ncbi:hypothetical protein Pfo_021033, partial [Paulownia fortunei]
MRLKIDDRSRIKIKKLLQLHDFWKEKLELYIFRLGSSFDRKLEIPTFIRSSEINNFSFCNKIIIYICLFDLIYLVQSLCLLLFVLSYTC